MNQPISIIMPAYRAEATIAGAVESVRAQTFTDWRLIVVADDGADYEALLGRSGLADSRFVFLDSGSVGSGASRARNVGLAAVPTRYAALLDAEGNTVAQAELIPMQLGTIGHVFQPCIQAYPKETLVEGDFFIINDPYVGAQHANDVQFCAPFFHEGKLVAWLGCMAHIIDLGGIDPGSWCPTATDVYQEGLRIPAGRIVRGGKVNQELWDIIVNNSRMPFTVANDFSAFLAEAS